MAAPRVSQFKALRNLQRVSASTPTKRGLHITGAQASPKPLDASHKTTYTPWSLQDLRSECRKRFLIPNGTKHELIDRLAGHDHLQARAFSIAMKRISSQQTRKPVSGPSETTPERHFNTSRELKAVGDTSTIDFAFLPKLFESSWGPQPAEIRVPILPHIESDDAEAVFEKFDHLDAAAGGYQDTTGHDTLMKPQISRMEGDSSSSTLLPMSDVHDGHHGEEMSVDQLANLSETIAQSAARITGAKEPGTVRKIWSGFLDDLFGAKK